MATSAYTVAVSNFHHERGRYLLKQGAVVAIHPVIDGRGQRRITAGHRTTPPPVNSQTPRHGLPPSRSGDVVALRSLSFYDAVGKRLADGAAA